MELNEFLEFDPEFAGAAEITPLLPEGPKSSENESTDDSAVLVSRDASPNEQPSSPSPVNIPSPVVEYDYEVKTVSHGKKSPASAGASSSSGDGAVARSKLSAVTGVVTEFKEKRRSHGKGRISDDDQWVMLTLKPDGVEP